MSERDAPDGSLKLLFRRLAQWGLGLAVPLLWVDMAAQAHGVVGDRFFPATLAIDDPFVADELAIPTFALLHSNDNVRELALDFEYAKRITDRFAISVAQGWHSQRRVGAGWQNLETSFKFQAFESPIHEFVLSAGVEVEWGRTGASGSVLSPRRSSRRLSGGARVRVICPMLWPGRAPSRSPGSSATPSRRGRRRSPHPSSTRLTRSGRSLSGTIAPSFGWNGAVQPALPQGQRRRFRFARFCQSPHPAG